MWIKNFFRSYSFRSAALIFCAFGITLVAVRLTTYAQSLKTAYADIRLVIQAHAEDLGENLERYGPAYTNGVVDSVIRDSEDEDLYIGLVSSAGIAGNFPRLADDTRLTPGWTELTLATPDGPDPLHLYVYVQSYAEGPVLMIAYNLHRVDVIRQSLPANLLENIELALAMAMIVSLLLVWLLNRHVRKFNTAFEKVSHGNLGYRIAVRSETDQFDRLARNLNDMLDWLTTMLEMSKEIGNSLAHDLRTPLSRHRLELCAISDSPLLPEPLKQRLDASVERIDELASMLNSILTISQAESRNPNELFEEVDVSELVESIVEFYTPMTEAKHLHLQTTKPAAGVAITGDRQLVSQAIMNLVDNAIKYTPEGGTVVIDLKSDKPGATLVVADNGSGVPAQALDKLKQRFFRADSSRNTPGSGLGLSLVEAVAILHHGTLTVENLYPGFRATLRFGLAVR